MSLLYLSAFTTITSQSIRYGNLFLLTSLVVFVTCYYLPLNVYAFNSIQTPSVPYSELKCETYSAYDHIVYICTNLITSHGSDLSG
jgi:hypothetical protein